ncbi:MAG: tRNA (N6-threonylcarbamoyladenosine(37)-N6)-methyltransferase TrmO [Candidatus Hydrogenedentes bacterium]|nr:tRNA (N6-threonylcarbamoyladenosine(37)-N6)-methyltransferase TrmO [Candidatus Hydrogenedentota bacterium]
MTDDAPVQSKPDMIAFSPIGFVRSPNTDTSATPIQPVYAKGIRGRIEILDQYTEALEDLDGFSYIHVLYYFHRAGPAVLKVKPFLDDVARGTFATRSPRRPNAIGLSIVRLVGREDSVLLVEDVDMLDGTPVLDIKPYVPRFDLREQVRAGWQDAVDEQTAKRRGRRE